MKPTVWLHISDLHRGQPGERTGWPTARESLLADLAGRARELGPPELIFITGDLAYAGRAGEYAQVDESLAQIGAAVGGRPLVIAVPGNHDLTRPDPGDAAARGFDHYEEDPSLRRAALRRGSSTHKQLEQKFAGYLKWWKRSILPAFEERKPELGLSFQAGLLPGDFLLKLTTSSGLRLGVVGLNSAYLQLRGGDYLHRLAVEPEQLPLDLPAALADTDTALLLMHHPPDWLSPRSLKNFERDLYAPQRFAACLFGHMHAARGLSTTGGSGVARRYLQASSLFGLEHYGEAGEERAVGYAWYALARVGPEEGELLRYPRRGVQRDDGTLAIDKDQSVDGYPQRFAIPLKRRAMTAPLLVGGAAAAGHPPRLDGATGGLRNPFVHAGRLSDPAQFVGRAALIDTIFADLRDGVSRALVGPTLVGKSSLLSIVKQLGAVRLAGQREVRYLNLQLIGSAGDFFDALCTELGLPEPLHGHRLERALVRAGRRFVLCLDEVEKLV